jgi:tol-pal system protein YbgF
MFSYPRYLIAACALSLCSLTYAGLFDDDEARKAILELRGKVEQQNKELAAKQTELGARTELLEQSSRGLLQLQNQIQTLRDEIAKLRGQLELQSNETAGLQKLVRDQKEVIAANESRIVATENRIVTTENRIKQFEPIAAQLDGKQITVDANEKKRYEAAIALVRAADFKAALTSLTQFQSAYPDSAYGPNVNYWIGSSLYATKDYKGAIAAFQGFLSTQGNHPRAADAQFTMGLAQIESGDRKTGRRTLEIISERFPDSPMSQSAKERLATLKP